MRVRHGVAPNISASTATSTRCGALFRPAAAARSIGIAFDPNDRKDQDGPHAVSSTNHG